MIVLVVAASLTTASMVVLSSPPHDEELALAVQIPEGEGPKTDRPIAMPPRLSGLVVALGLRDEEPTEWEGDIEVSEGRVFDLEVVAAAPGAVVENSHFRVDTQRVTTKKKQAAQKKQVAKKKPAAKKKQAANAEQQGPVVATVLRMNLDAPLTANVVIKTNHGRITTALSDLDLYTPKTFLGGQVSIARQDGSIRLSGPPTEDDYPVAAKGPDGTVWMAYVAYQPERARLTQAVDPEDFDTVLVPKGNGDQILLRRFDGKAWHPPIEVTGKGLDVWRPTVAVNGKGEVVVAWAQQIDGNWDLYYRTLSPGKDGGAGSWSQTVRLTDDPGSDFHAVSATDAKGNVWLAWQAWRDGNYEILSVVLAEGHDWSKARVISDSPANDWSPAIVADAKGNVFAAWDTYDKGNYDVRLRLVGKEADPIAIAGSARFEARCSLACDPQDRIWIAYEEGDEQWGKDYSSTTPERVPVENKGFALYVNRTLRVKCLENGRLMQPEGSLEDAFGNRLSQGKSVPRIASDPSGGIWLLFRHHPQPNGAGEVWHGYATHHDGKAWSIPRHLIDSAGLIDNRPALVPLEQGLLIVHSTDQRLNANNRGQFDLFASFLKPDSREVQAPKLVADTPAPEPKLSTVHPNEAEDIARMRAYRIESGGKTLRLLRGEFHRHTEVSSHRDQDGLLEDTWRYALDAADHDWMGNGDHHNGYGYEYMWWFIQKMTDLHLNAPRFVSAVTYERSAVYPNGHRNVILPKRGIRPLPFGDLSGTPEEGTPDTKNLYVYLKHFGGICASHTSATNMGTDWRDNDPEVEPVVEIYQGHRHNYEHFGAPRSPTEATQIGGYQPAGFVWNALQKGYRLGFQSSSDHVSTHWSYAVVLAEDVSRQGIIDAFKKRHSYAATDNIILDVRSGEHLMGDVFTTDKAPTLRIVAQGTTPIAKLDIIRDNKYAFSTEPKQVQIQFQYTDDDAKPGESHYYYVRVTQEDGNLAWASPMWITYQK